jgi:hypothetical protein
MTFTKRYRWRVYSPSAGQEAYVESDIEPTVFPLDGSALDPDATVIVEELFTEIKSKGAVAIQTADADGIQLQSESAIAQRTSAGYLTFQPEHAILSGAIDLVIPAQILLSRIIVATTSRNVIWTLPPPEAVVALFTAFVDGDSLDFSVINLGNRNINMRSGFLPPNRISVGNMRVEGETTGRFRLRLKNATSYVLYRV